MAAKAKDKLTPDGEKFFKEIEKLKKLQVRVGYQQGNVVNDEGVDLLDVAMFNELGTSTSPSRPFMAKSVDENADKINAFLKQQLVLLAQGKTTAEGILKAPRWRPLRRRPITSSTTCRAITFLTGISPTVTATISRRIPRRRRSPRALFWRALSTWRMTILSAQSLRTRQSAL